MNYARHHAITNALISSEKQLVWFRDVTGLPWVRETKLNPPIHANSIFKGDVVGLTIDINGDPCRVFYLMHDRELDGIGHFTDDVYNGIPARTDKIAINEFSWPPSYDVVPPEGVIEREKANHAAKVSAWKRHHPEPVAEPVKKTLLQRIFRR